RHPLDRRTLALVQRLQPITAPVSPARLHLDERHHVCPASHQVEIVLPQTPPVRLDLPAALHERLRRSLLGVIAELVTGVGERLVIHGASDDVRFTIYDLRCTIYDVRFSLYDLRCTTCDVRCTMCDVRCAMYDVRFAVHALRFAI